MDVKSYENILIYIVYKIPYRANPLCIVLDKVDGYIRKNGQTKCLALFCSNKKYDRIFDRIKYTIMLKSNISDVRSQRYTKIKINSDDDLPLENYMNLGKCGYIYYNIKTTTMIFLLQFLYK